MADVAEVWMVIPEGSRWMPILLFEGTWKAGTPPCFLACHSAGTAIGNLESVSNKDNSMPRTGASGMDITWAAHNA